MIKYNTRFNDYAEMITKAFPYDIDITITDKMDLGDDNLKADFLYNPKTNSFILAFDPEQPLTSADKAVWFNDTVWCFEHYGFPGNGAWVSFPDLKISKSGKQGLRFIVAGESVYQVELPNELLASKEYISYQDCVKHLQKMKDSLQEQDYKIIVKKHTLVPADKSYTYKWNVETVVYPITWNEITKDTSKADLPF